MPKPHAGDPKLAVAYVRVSTDTDRQALGAQAQRDAITRWAEGSGITIVQWFVEEVSGGAVSPAATDSYFQLKLYCNTGVLPRGAQVRTRCGRWLSPLSSASTITRPSRRAFFSWPATPFSSNVRSLPGCARGPGPRAAADSSPGR